MARKILTLEGSDRVRFLQSLVSNDVTGRAGKLVYAALLSPQGKYLFDFFVLPEASRFLIDISADMAEAFQARLNMYRLRADVQIADSPLCVHQGLSECPEDGFVDPRHADLGWRAYRAEAQENVPDLTDIRITHVIPKAGCELIQDDTYILEAGFERLNGVDFKKGCFIGQEIVARMKYKTKLAKGFCRLHLHAPIPANTPLYSGTKKVGRICTSKGLCAIGYLHYARADEALSAAGILVALDWRPQ